MYLNEWRDIFAARGQSASTRHSSFSVARVHGQRGCAHTISAGRRSNPFLQVSAGMSCALRNAGVDQLPAAGIGPIIKALLPAHVERQRNRLAVEQLEGQHD